ncbi:hypothetical protein [Marinobacterium aestuariivivens]|uniref:Uncharacterized protein n=1 Tax=Marinobacterium aestuariivivens TaxID=1698799 RepID=A0ABW1ZYJ1_9GAMM
MTMPEQYLIRRLNELLQLAVESSLVEVYGPPSHLYHCGLYSNQTSLWSHSPGLLEPPDRGYLITATPKSVLRLAILSNEAVKPLFDEQVANPEGLGRALETICGTIEYYCPLCGLDGFALTPLDGGIHYRHIVLFRPLDALNLYDIEPLEPKAQRDGDGDG